MAPVKIKDYRFTHDYADDFGNLIESLQYPSGTATFIQQLAYSLKNIDHPHRYIEFWPDRKIYRCAELINDQLQAILRDGATSKGFANLTLTFGNSASNRESR